MHGENSSALRGFWVAALVGSLLLGLAGGVAAAHWGVIERAHRVVWGGTPVQTSPPVVPDSLRGQLKLFVLAGQSNMSGRGRVRDADRQSVPGVWTFANDYRWTAAQAPVDDPTGQVDSVSLDPWVGLGPGLSFARTLRNRHPDIGIGLIPCAMGGSAIDEWMPHRSERSLYGSCLKRIRAATPLGDVAGILFMQGETDALAADRRAKATSSPHQWRSKFSAIVQSWREDLGHPDLPVVFGQIGSHRAAPGRFPHWETVQSQQQSVSLPATAMVQTGDLRLRDAVHFTREGAIVLGKRMAEAWLDLLSSSRGSTGGVETPMPKPSKRPAPAPHRSGERGPASPSPRGQRTPQPW